MHEWIDKQSIVIKRANKGRPKERKQINTHREREREEKTIAQASGKKLIITCLNSFIDKITGCMSYRFRHNVSGSALIYQILAGEKKINWKPNESVFAID